VAAVLALFAVLALSAVSADFAFGTSPSDDSLICLPVSESSATAPAVTACACSFVAVTDAFFNWLVPTELAGRLVTA
jgi:hypothetical protein